MDAVFLLGTRGEAVEPAAWRGFNLAGDAEQVSTQAVPLASVASSLRHPHVCTGDSDANVPYAARLRRGAGTVA